MRYTRLSVFVTVLLVSSFATLIHGQETPEKTQTPTPTGMPNCEDVIAELTAEPEITLTLTDQADAGEAMVETATPEATSAADEVQQSEFVSVDAEAKTVTLTVIAALDNSNGGLNFNGYANGNATFTVPQGWTVNVQYCNASLLPHSVGVLPTSMIDQQQLPAEPAFEGAIMEEFHAGSLDPAEFSFVASDEGTFAMVCGVPGHATSGQWIYFEVGEPDVQPSFQTSD